MSIPVGGVPIMVKQISSAMDGTGVPEAGGSPFTPKNGGKGILIYADPDTPATVVGTSKGGLFSFDGHASILGVFASCGAGGTFAINVKDGTVEGDAKTYKVVTGQDGNDTYTAFDHPIPVLPSQDAQVIVTGGSGNKIIGLLVVKYPDQA